jgi:hypothetical protein
MTWQPIETAPRDGQWILLRGGKTAEDVEPLVRARPVVAQAAKDAFGVPCWVFAHWDGGWRGKYENPIQWAPVNCGNSDA